MNETPSTSTAPHLLPDACHVCGAQEDRHAAPERAGDLTAFHQFWSNADALAEAREYDRRTTVTYSDGTTSPEAHFVAAFVPEAVTR